MRIFLSFTLELLQLALSWQKSTSICVYTKDFDIFCHKVNKHLLLSKQYFFFLKNVLDWLLLTQVYICFTKKKCGFCFIFRKYCYYLFIRVSTNNGRLFCFEHEELTLEKIAF